MKQLALKTRQSLALVPATDTVSATDDLGKSFVKAFRGWLTPVPKHADGLTLRPLTTEDFVEVELATIRESRTHAFWPTEVIAKFLHAELDVQ